MRVLGFSKRWQKLSNQTFTTFRYRRVDKDWFIGELVQIIIQPRRKGGGDKLGVAEIVSIEGRELCEFFRHVAPLVTDEEAIADGFDSLKDMVKWMEKTYGRDYISYMKKLILRWV